MTLNALPERKREYVKNLAKGMDKRSAALSAGYSKSTARCPGDRIENEDVREVMRSLVHAAIPPKQIVETLRAGLEATETRLASFEGKFTDERKVPDYGKRLAYAEVAAEYGGYVMKEQPVAQHLHLLAMMPDPQPSPTIDTTSTIITDTGGTPAPPAKHA